MKTLVANFSCISMSVIAAILCLVFLRKLSGVREGTIIAALITGNIVKLFTRKIHRSDQAAAVRERKIKLFTKTLRVKLFSRSLFD